LPAAGKWAGFGAFSRSERRALRIVPALRAKDHARGMLQVAEAHHPVTALEHKVVARVRIRQALDASHSLVPRAQLQRFFLGLEVAATGQENSAQSISSARLR
jgi:hypothetical protein